MPLKFVTVNDNVFQLLFSGTSSPRPPTGAPPLDPAGGLPSQVPQTPSLVQFYNFLKKSPDHVLYTHRKMDL